MSWRHLHVTTFISDKEGLPRFLAAARNQFESVQPVIRQPDGRVVGAVFYTSDLDDCAGWIYTLPEAVEALSGILAEDIEIVSAWNSDDRPEVDRPRIWRVPGRKPQVASAPGRDALSA